MRARSIALILAVLLDGCWLRPPDRDRTPQNIVATYGSRVLTKQEALEAITRLPPPARAALIPTERKRAFVENLVLSKLLYEEGELLGFTNDPALRRQPKEARNAFVVQMVIAAHRVTPPVGDDEARRYYDSNAKRYVRKGRVPAFETVREPIRSFLADQKAEEQVRAHLERLKQATDLRVRDDALASLDPVAGLTPPPAPPAPTGH